MAAEMGRPPETEHHHHHLAGRRWLDITLAVSALFISLMSLFLAIQHYTPHVRLLVESKGVGRAQVESLEVFYNGVAQTGGQALLDSILVS
jgi:hypothetical protein